MKPSLRVLVAMAAMIVVLFAGAAPAMAKAADRNHNKIPDKWERKYHLSMKKGQWKKDKDKDGLNALNEYFAKTSPLKKDSDRDGVRDGSEDRDRDGLPNLAEVRSKTSIRYADTDKDGVRDAHEDPDADDLDNAQEWVSGTDPLNPDSDDNGVYDCDEDTDDDGLDNRDEFRAGTHPRRGDSDGDGIGDAREDGDHDGLDNRRECDEGSDPRDADSDDDGIVDGAEVRGTIASFDPETGVLTIDSGRDDGLMLMYTMAVDENTALSWSDSHSWSEGEYADDSDEVDGLSDDEGETIDEGFSEASIDDLIEGTIVKHAEIETVDGVVRAREIVLVPADDEGPFDFVAEIGGWDPDSSTLTLFMLADGGDYYEFLIDEGTVFEWADGTGAGVEDLAEGTAVAELETSDLDDGTSLVTRIVLIPLDTSPVE